MPQVKSDRLCAFASGSMTKRTFLYTADGERIEERVGSAPANPTSISLDVRGLERPQPDDLGRRSAPVEPGAGNAIAGSKGLQKLQKLAPIGPRAGHLLPVNLGAARRAQLLKLRGKGLPVGADAGIAERPGRGALFGHILREV